MISTGYSSVDEITGGLQSGEVTVIAGRPAMGKSAFVLGMACNMAFYDDKSVAVFTLEMPNEQLLTRLFYMKPYVNRKDMQLGCFEGGGNAILRNVGRTDTGKLIINDNHRISIRELISECHKLKGKHNVQTIIIDYLQLMTGSPKEDRSREEELSEISESLKKLAQELDISVVALSMLRNTVEQRVNHRPALSDFIPEYYGPLADNSDLIMFIYRDDYYHKDSCKKGKAEIIVAKNNHGRTGTVEIAWIPEYCSFCEIWRI